MRKTRSFVTAAALLMVASIARADLVVNTNLGTLGFGSTPLSGTTVGGPNNASTYTNAAQGSLWDEEFVFQFTATVPFQPSITTNDPNGAPSAFDNDFFLANTLATPGGVGQVFNSIPAGTYSGVEVNGGWGVQPAGTYYLIADSFRAIASNPSRATAFTGTLNLAPVIAATPPASDAANLGGSITGTLAPGEVNFYRFTTDGGTYSFNTDGTNLLGSGDNDTELLLFDIAGNLIGENDDNEDNSLSLLNVNLGAGTYYLAFGAFDTAVATSGFDVESDSTDSGSFVINGISVVPEPTALAALAAALLVRRRRS